MTWSVPDPLRSTVLAAPGRAAVRPVRPPRWREDAVVGLFTVAACVLLGAPLGLAWAALAPHAHVVIDANGPNVVDGATEVFIAADGWFLGLTLLAGILTGVLGWLVARRSAPVVVVALTLGGVVAAYVVSLVGARIGREALLMDLRGGRYGTYLANVALQSKQAILAWPLGAVAAFATLVLSRVEEIE